MRKAIEFPVALLAMCVAAMVVAAVIPQAETPAVAAEVQPVDLAGGVAASIDAQANRIDTELDARPVLEVLAPEPSREPRREVRRWSWLSPEATRERLWSIPATEDAEAEATAFLRVCLAEADGHEADCIGIWQVVRNIRSRSCRRSIKTITECDANGETMLSAMRRAAKHVTGGVPPRTYRQRWVAEVELSCAEPASWPTSSKLWQAQYGSKRCPRVAQLARDLVAGAPGITWTFRAGLHPIAWGGRCEDSGGACDDHIACARGLARLQTSTKNAFWARAPAGFIDPVCRPGQGKKTD